MKSKQQQLKTRVVAIIQRNGRPIRTEDLAGQLTLPAGVTLDELLTDMVAEGHLTRGYTLLANGHMSYTFDLRDTA